MYLVSIEIKYTYCKNHFILNDKPLKKTRHTRYKNKYVMCMSVIMF